MDLDFSLEPLESGVFAMEQLAELAVHISWSYPRDSSQEEKSSWKEHKRQFKAGIRYILSRVVQRRSGQNFPPLKARLFVLTNKGQPRRPKENKLVWSSGSMSPDDELRDSWSHYCRVRGEPVNKIPDIAF